MTSNEDCRSNERGRRPEKQRRVVGDAWSESLFWEGFDSCPYCAVRAFLPLMHGQDRLAQFPGTLEQSASTKRVRLSSLRPSRNNLELGPPGDPPDACE